MEHVDSCVQVSMLRRMRLPSGFSASFLLLFCESWGGAVAYSVLSGDFT